MAGPWPSTIPPSLEAKLEEVQGRRAKPNPSDFYAAFVEWCEANGINPQGPLDTREEINAHKAQPDE